MGIQGLRVAGEDALKAAAGKAGKLLYRLGTCGTRRSLFLGSHMAL